MTALDQEFAKAETSLRVLAQWLGSAGLHLPVGEDIKALEELSSLRTALARIEEHTHNTEKALRFMEDFIIEHGLHDAMVEAGKPAALSAGRNTSMNDRLAHIDACLTHAEFVPTSVTREDVLALVEIAKAALVVVDEYHKWSEDANDGEFALWRKEDLINAIIATRVALSVLDDREET